MSTANDHAGVLVVAALAYLVTTLILYTSGYQLLYAVPAGAIGPLMVAAFASTMHALENTRLA